MKKLLFVLFISGAIAKTSVAQAPQIYAELGGPSVVGINFDSRFSKKENGFGGRIGVGGFSIEGSGFFFLPVGINYLLGKDGTKHYLELGAGFTYVNYKEQGFEGDPDNKFANTFGHLTIGYRYQPQGTGVTFRATINPIIDFKGGTFWPFYGGFSVGYKIK